MIFYFYLYCEDLKKCFKWGKGFNVVSFVLKKFSLIFDYDLFYDLFYLYILLLFFMIVVMMEVDMGI